MAGTDDTARTGAPESREAGTGWEVVARRLTADRSPYARVYDLDLRLPDGRVIADWLHVELPPFVIMFVLLEDGRVPFVRQYRQAVGDYMLELPAGHIEPGEAEEAAAIRELREETGVEAGAWQFLGKYVMDANRDCGWAYVYLARGARLVAPADHGDLGEMSLHLLTLAEVRQRWLAGEWVSAPTALAVGLALAMLGA